MDLPSWEVSVLIASTKDSIAFINQSICNKGNMCQSKAIASDWCNPPPPDGYLTSINMTQPIFTVQAHFLLSFQWHRCKIDHWVQTYSFMQLSSQSLKFDIIII